MSSFQRIIKYCAIALAIILAVGIISFIVNAVFGIVTFTSGRVITTRTYTSQEIETMDFSDTFTGVKSLDIDNSTGELTIKTGDTFKVEAKNVLKNFEAKVKSDGRLVISDNESGFQLFGIHFKGFNSPNSKITIYLPEDFVAEEVRIDSGAGAVTAEELHTGYLYISAGAGNIKGSGLIADKVKVEGGVGSITLSKVDFKDADINCGMGSLNIDGVLAGNNKLDCGIGTVNLDLTGNIDDYDLDIDSGIGKIRVNGMIINENAERNRSAKNFLKVDGGIGNVKISIEE